MSTFTGGGSSYILIPLVSLLLGASAVPPVITTGMLLGNFQRVVIYRKSINWQVFCWYLPGGIIGACFGAFVLSKTKIEWLTLILALFLIISASNIFLNQGKKTFEVKLWYFLPSGFIYAFLSGLIGSTGPLMTPFYINYGLVKEDLIATRAVNIATVHAVKIIAYAFFGAWTTQYLVYGLMIGAAALPGNWLGQIVVEKMSEQRFQQMVVAFIMFSGMLLMWQERQFFLIW